MAGKTPLLILGTHAFAEEVADLVQLDPAYDLAGFIENLDRTRCDTTLLGKPVYWIDEAAHFADTHEAVCAIGTTKRYQFTAQAEALGFTFGIVKHPSVILFPSVEIGSGCILSAGVIVSSNVVLGKHVILNRGVMIGHHTQVGSHVTINPGCNIAGRISIDDQVYVGMGATIINDITIGRQSIIGAGSVVSKPVPERVMVLGYPAVIARRDVDGM